MVANGSNSAVRELSGARRSGLRWGGVVFALAFPTIITWAYFVLAGRYSTSAQQLTYLVVKTIQFAFPLVWVWFVLHEPLRTGRPTARGLVLGAAFSVVVVGVGWLLFARVLREADAFSGAAALIHEKIGGFGIDSVGKYVVLAAFYSLFHSLLEEYYWRWFVFRQLRALVPLWPAILISALGFMAHHVVVLGEFFQETPWLAWLFASAVAVGGMFWAWLYERSGSLFGPWLSHLLIDAGIFWIGYDLVRVAMSG
jgi:membrane protease YdiL (CAAX protease family)